MPNPDISVVIPAYRAEATIRRAIDSVLRQEASARIVVVIDGALDRTAQTIADYPPERVTVVEHAVNRGAAISRNNGLARVDTDHVMFLDADDFLEGPLLEGLLQAIRRSGADVAFGPMQILHEARGHREPKFVPDFASPEDAFRRWHLEGIFVTPCSVLWRTEFLRSIGGWDPELTRNDDGELVNRAFLKGARIAVSHQGCGVYVKHSTESLNNRTDNMDSMIRANEKLLAIDPPALPPDVRHHVCAGHYYNIAWNSYLSGRDDLGDIALRRSRAMGFRSRGPLSYRIAAAVLGVRPTCRLIARIKSHIAGAAGSRRGNRW